MAITFYDVTMILIKERNNRQIQTNYRTDTYASKNTHQTYVRATSEARSIKCV